MKEEVKKIINDAVKGAGFSLPDSFNIENPPKVEMGDWSSNVALVIASRKKLDPKEVALKITKKLSSKKEIEKAEMAGPGFINIFIKNEAYLLKLQEIIVQGENFGKSSAGRGKRIQVESVSANPTGPLHVGNARGGPIGEALANLFAFLGYKVEREFYVNDVGGQVKKFGESLYYWYEIKDDSKIIFPEGGYPGDYVKEISNLIQKEKKSELEILKERSLQIEFFVKEGLYHVLKSIREDCELIGVRFDQWKNQSDFEHSGKTETVIVELKKANFTTNKEGALWFRSAEDPEVNDRESVLVKGDGKLTYFADDIAYHLDKFERGFSKVIDIWGANHHGHIPRLRAALEVLGIPADKLEIILYQYVRLKKAGKVVSMGKRTGNFVTLREVIESGVAPDAFKYFVLTQNPNTPFDFDLAAAADTSEKNPVFYIKYAHARICSILRKTGEGAELFTKGDLSLLKNEKEIALYKELIKFPDLLRDISSDFQIQALPHFTYKIATLFHDFYANCQVLTEDKKLSVSRLSLIVATKYVLANALSVLGIESPEKM